MTEPNSREVIGESYLRAAAVGFTCILLALLLVLSSFGSQRARTGHQPGAIVSPGTVRTFFLEARVQPLLTPEQRARYTTVELAEAVAYIRFWGDGDTRWRWQIGPKDGSPSQTRVLIAEGNRTTVYEPETNTYASEVGPEHTPLAIMFALTTFWIGPLPAELGLQQLLDSVGAAANQVRQAQILGLDVLVFEGPSRSQTTLRQTGPGASTGSTTYVGRQEIWFSRELGMILRLERDPDGDRPGVLIEVERLEVNQPVDPRVFSFTPPRSARAQPTAPPRAQPTPPSAGPGSPGWTFSSRDWTGLLEPTYIPAGFSQTSVATSFAGGVLASKDITLTSRSGGAIEIKQRYRAGQTLDRPAASAVVTLARGQQVFRVDTMGRVTLTWLEEDVVVSLMANPELEAELLRIAESMVKR